jgi:hypothetical protein
VDYSDKYAESKYLSKPYSLCERLFVLDPTVLCGRLVDIFNSASMEKTYIKLISLFDDESKVFMKPPPGLPKEFDLSLNYYTRVSSLSGSCGNSDFGCQRELCGVEVEVEVEVKDD